MKEVEKNVCYYLVLASVSCLSIILGLCWENWFSYCWFYFGLFMLKNFAIPSYEGISSYSELQREVCYDSVQKGFVETGCPDFCSSLEKFKVAQSLELGFSIVTLVLLMLLMVLHIKFLAKGKCQFRFVSFLYIGAFAVFSAGLAVYGLVGGIFSVSKVNKEDFLDQDKPQNLKIGGGLIWHMLSVLVLMLQCICGMALLKKYFCRRKSIFEELQKQINLQELIFLEEEKG